MTWAEDMKQFAEDFREEYKEAVREEHDQWWEGDRAEWNEWNGRHWTGDIETRIDDLFTDFASGDLEAAELIVADLNEAADVIDDDINTNLDRLEKRLTNWTGGTADEFAGFMGQLKDRVAVNLKERIEATRLAMERYIAALRERDRIVLDLVNSTQQSLATAEAEEKAREERIKLTILDGLTNFSVQGSSGATLLAVAGQLKSTYISVKILALGGVKRSEVIASMVDNGERIVAESREASGRVQRALHAVTEHLTFDNLVKVRVDRPAVVTDERFDPNKFRNPGQSEDITRDVRKSDVVSEPPKEEDQSRDYGTTLQDPFDWDRFDDAYPEQ